MRWIEDILYVFDIFNLLIYLIFPYVQRTKNHNKAMNVFMSMSSDVYIKPQLALDHLNTLRT